MGTRWMATNEAPIHDNVKQALVDGDENSTMLIMRSMKNTERVYKNKAAMDVLELENQFPGDFSKVSHIIKGENYRRVFQDSGSIDEGKNGNMVIFSSTEPISCGPPLTKKTHLDK